METVLVVYCYMEVLSMHKLKLYIDFKLDLCINICLSQDVEDGLCYSVPAAVLCKKFSDAAKCFLDLLARYSDSGSASLVKSVSIIALLPDCISYLHSEYDQLYLGHRKWS